MHLEIRPWRKSDAKSLQKHANNRAVAANLTDQFPHPYTLKHAKAFIKIQEEFGSFDKYIWSFTGNKTIKNSYKTLKDIPATSKESDAMSKDLKKRGFKFVGSTICYAFMQAAGMVNDHEVGCFRYNEV